MRKQSKRTWQRSAWAQMIDNTRWITVYLSLWFSCPRFSRVYTSDDACDTYCQNGAYCQNAWLLTFHGVDYTYCQNGGQRVLIKIADTILAEWDIWYYLSSVAWATLLHAIHAGKHVTVPSINVFSHKTSVGRDACNYLHWHRPFKIVCIHRQQLGANSLFLNWLNIHGTFNHLYFYVGNCPPDKPRHYCLIPPCVNAKCPAYPDAKCVDNHCGGCNADFYIGGKKVKCGELGFGFCPKSPPNSVVIARHNHKNKVILFYT
jgi:hypothetical protein